MKLKKLLLSLVLLPLVASCQQSNHLYYCFLNGDLASVNASTATYESVCEKREIDDLLSESDLGHPILLAVTSKDCSHCASFEPVFTQFVLSYQLDVALLEHNEKAVDTEFDERFSKLKDHYSSFDFSSFGTPSIFYLSQNSISYFQQGATDLGHLENVLKGQGSPLSGLTRYEEASNVPEGKDEPLFFYDRDNETAASFYETLWAKAKDSSKVLRLVDYGAMSEADQKAMLAHYGLSSYQPLFIADHIPYLLDQEKEMATATSYLSTYYQ